MEAVVWDHNLSAEQIVAASQFGSHARLLAGPGTGKTHTLSRKVVYFVTEKEVAPSEILVLTFTRMATRQLRTTIRRDLAQYSREMPYISTLHGFSLRQLRRNSNLDDTLPQPLRIADDWEESEIIYEEMKDLLNRSRDEIRQRFIELSADWQTLRADEENWRKNVPDAAFLGMWEEHRRLYGYMLRSELVYQLKRGMGQVAGFELEPRFKHVLIDEYQDLNPCDLAIAQEIAAKGAMVLACGDDDQSIYGFRFANPSGIRTFTEQFEGSTDLALTECRRCDAEILRTSIWVAEQDVRRVHKELHAAPGNGAGEVRLLRFQNGAGEAAGVAALCRQLIDEGTSPGEIMILLRSDHQGALSRPLQQALQQRGVEVAASVEKRNILDELHGRKFLSMLRLIDEPNDHLAWRTRLHTWARIGPKAIKPFYEFARQEGVDFSSAVRRLPEFVQTLRSPAPQILSDVISNTNVSIDRFSPIFNELESQDSPATTDDLKDLIRQVAETEIAEEDGRPEVLAFISELIDSSGATNLKDLFASMVAGREEMEAEIDQTRVSVLTMHQAKGLSADAVFVISAEDEVLPKKNDARSVEEDRRLLYVSMTRARHKLFITYCGRRDGQQRHSGRNAGQPNRQLTRYLRDSGLQPEAGEQFVG